MSGGHGTGGGGRTAAVIRVAIGVVALSTLTVCGGFAQTWRTLSTTRQVHGEHALDVHVSYGAGKFTLGPGPSGTLYRMDLKYDEERELPLREYDEASGSLRVGIRSLSDHHVSFGGRRHDEPSSLALALAPGLPLTLDIEMGAAQADLQLGSLAIRELHYKTGASESVLRFATLNPVACDEMTVDVGAAALRTQSLANANCRRMTFNGGVGAMTLNFAGEWRQALSARVNVGIGSVTLELPRSLGVAIRMTRFLATFDQAGFVKRGDMYYSNNYQTARNRLTLDVNATLGGVEVNWID